MNSYKLLHREEIPVDYSPKMVLVGVQGGLVHCRVADEPLGSGEGDAGRREAVALVVGDDLAAVALPHGHARVGRAEVDADRRAIALQLQAVRHLPSQSS